MIGVWFSAFIHGFEPADIGGEIPGSHIHGISVLLVGFFSLPWSIPVWLIGGMVSDGELPAWLYWSMPPIAGMGWGWLVSVILAKVRSERERQGRNGASSD